MKSCEIADVLRGVLPCGCVQPYINGFAEHLAGGGYAFLVVRDYVRAAGHLGRWMNEHSLSLRDLHDGHLEEFAGHACACPGSNQAGCPPSSRHVERVRRFVDYMGHVGAISALTGSPALEVPKLLMEFRFWLLKHRGLTKVTAVKFEHLVSKMLPGLGDAPDDYNAALVRRVLLAQIRGRTPVYAKSFITALRTFLRFLASEGRCQPNLDRAVPTIPQWTLAALPHHLPAADVERVIDSCNLDLPHGVRDRAVLLLLARLGLRAGDIVDMRMADIIWATGTLRVRGKGHRETSLPLPQDAGDALLRYLAEARPAFDDDHTFLCANAPFRPLGHSSTVSCIVMLALRRVGITDAPSRGAHLLRHSAAVCMLESGVSVDAISTILRHSSSDMTAYYAKVDVALLGSVAQPWPEGAPC